jgi:CRP-like cAMP-binding protein
MGLSGLATGLTFKAGAVLARQGDIGKEFVVIEKGRVVVAIDDTFVRTLEPGEYFGEIALLKGCRRTATVFAATEVNAQVISDQELRSMFYVVPRLADTLRAEAERRLKNTDSDSRFREKIA